MVKLKKLRISIITLLLAVVLALTAAGLILSGKTSAVYAATSDRYVELDGNSVFYTSIRGAEITETEEFTEGEGDEATKHRYTQFNIGNSQTISYRQNLAYSWISGGKDEDGKFNGLHSEGKFSMQLSFADATEIAGNELGFERYIIDFGSQQYTMTKDGKTHNYLIFTPVDNGSKLEIKVAQSIEEDEEDGSIEGEQVVQGYYDRNEKITLSLGDYESGNYKLIINGAAVSDQDGKPVTFKNVFESYAAYVSSGDNAVTPLTFSAEFPEGITDRQAKMILYAINGQSFEMFAQSSSSDVYRVKDTAAPVMCFSETPAYLEHGSTINFEYRVIDVLASSPRSTAYYYILTGEQYGSSTFDYDRVDYETKETDDAGSDGTDNGDSEENKPKSPFIQVTSSSSIRLLRDQNTFIPKDYIDAGNVFGLVKIYYEISDVSSSSTAQKDIVFAEWYAKDSALVDIYGAGFKNDSEKSSKFFKLIDSKKGATYAESEDATLEEYKTSVKNFQEAYQQKIDDAIAELEDGKLYAGGEKFYLPAIEYPFMDEYSTGRDYSYSIYYRGNSKGSATKLDANKIAIDLSEADVTYRFTIYVHDTMSNSMRYPSEEVDENGKIIWKEISVDDVWEEEYADLLPFFEFDVSYKAATAEKSDNISVAYVGSNFSSSVFKITGVASTYTSNYNLYIFDRSAFNREVEENFDYNKFEENLDKLFSNTYKEGVNTRKYFTTVKASSDLLESDAHYEEFKALDWNPTSVSFTPQTVEDFYVIELTLTDNRSDIKTTNYATIAASVQTTPLKGEDDWLENNKTSIILFVVAGVCLIALIVLLVVKPKDKGDIDVVYANEVEGEAVGGKKKDKRSARKKAQKDNE